MVTLTTAEKALKTLYLGVVSNQLNTGINPLLSKIQQSTADVWGKDVKKLAPIGVNGGIGAGDESDTLPQSAQNRYVVFTSALKNLYGTIELSDKAIRASSNNAGAFVNLLNAEMEGLVKASTFNFGRMLYGDGSGKLATITDALKDEDSAVNNYAITVDSIKNIVEGMVIDIYEKASITPLKAKARIESIDRVNKIVYLDSSVSSLSMIFAEADLEEGETMPTYFICVQNSLNKELTGLSAIFGTGDLYGLSRTENKWLNPLSKAMGTTETFSDVTIQSVIDNLSENYDSQVDFIVCSSGVKRAYQSYLNTYRSNIDVMELTGGYKALSYNGIPLISDRFAPVNTMYLLNTKEFTLHQLCDWRWLEGEDGRVLKQVANKPVFTATLVKYAELICDKPCGQGKITGITEA